MFLGHFWSFLPDGDFFQKIQLCHTQLYMAPNTMLSFRKNQWANPEKTYGQTEGRTEGQTDRPYFIGPFQPRPRVQKNTKKIKQWLKSCKGIDNNIDFAKYIVTISVSTSYSYTTSVNVRVIMDWCVSCRVRI